jgi:DNA topoisomerase VI subunit B
MTIAQTYEASRPRPLEQCPVPGTRHDNSLHTPRLAREAFTTSRLLEFCSKKELINQTGHAVEEWPLVILKELVDNALDACEEAEVSPHITVTVANGHVVVADNGPGIGAEVVKNILNYNVRVSLGAP